MAGEQEGMADDYSSTDEVISPLMSQENFPDLGFVQLDNLEASTSYDLFDPALLNLDSCNSGNFLPGDGVLPAYCENTQVPKISNDPNLLSTVNTLQSTYTQLNPREIKADPTTIENEGYNLQSQLRPDGIPSENCFKSFKGVHGFDISFHGNDQPTKSTPWTYSKTLDKLFVSFNLPCPIQFNISSEPPFGSVIRAMPYFKQPVDIDDPVTRCLHHQMLSEPTNQGFHHVNHVIRCDSLGSTYHEDPSSNRLSVIVPYHKRMSALNYTSFNYFFTCFSSCVGGMNRRPIVVAFSLEHGNRVLGQKVIEVRVCACPGRDRFKSEDIHRKNIERSNNSLNASGRNETGSTTQSLRRRALQNSQVNSSSDENAPPKKKAKNEESDVFKVSVEFVVRGKRNAEIYQDVLESIKRSACQPRP